MERLKFVGQWLEHSAAAIYDTTYAAPLAGFNGKVTRRGGSYYLHLFDWPAAGRLELADFPAQVSGAALLAGAALTFRQTLGRLEIDLPAQAPDATVSVVVIHTQAAL